jgi:hypothetical protein
MRARLARFLSIAAAAWAVGFGGGSPALAAASGEEPAILSNVVRDVTLRSEPVTIALAGRSGFAPALDAARRGGGAVVLALRNIQGRSTQPIRLNVFVDKPDADRATPSADPHFLGFVYLIPTRSEVRGGHAFDLSGLQTPDGGALRITLVPIAGTDAAPRDAALSVGQIDIRRED